LRQERREARQRERAGAMLFWRLQTPFFEGDVMSLEKPRDRALAGSKPPNS